MQWAKIFGAKDVVVFDIADERLKLGERLGATGSINTLEDDFMQKAMALTDGRGFDYVFETAGNTITMKMAFELAANKAEICFVGTPTKELSFSTSNIYGSAYNNRNIDHRKCKAVSTGKTDPWFYHGTYRYDGNIRD